jgi:DNA-binding response OmpR family regulator
MEPATPERPLILAVDDNAYTLRIVQHTLRQADYEPMTAVSGEEALEAIRMRGLPDLAIVDLHMPGGMSGFEFCHSVHQFSDLPIIMLTAVGDEDTVLEGLEKHAEDYIVKPFGSGELVARVSRILGRMGRMNFASTPLTHVDEQLQINFPDREALVNEKPVALTPTETRLLYILMRQAGEPAFEDRLHVHLHRLRRKIEDEQSDTPREYIMSERGKGYVFNPRAGETAT